MNKKGMALLTIIFLFILIGGLLAIGVTLIGPMTKKVKYNETKTTIDAAVKAVLSWSVANNRIPDASGGTTGFARVVGNPNDTWGKPLVYIAADNLLNPSPIGICNRQTTNLKVSPVTDDIAFVVLSGSEDYTVDSTPNTSQAYNGTVTLSENDIVKWVTLKEVLNKSGCYGTTQGVLKILNNELPTNACSGTGYTAGVYADGGVSFTSGGKYRWCIQTTSGTLPAGMNATPSVVNTNCQGLAEGSWGQEDRIQLSGTPTTAGTYNLTFFVRDNNDPSGINDGITQKTLPISIVSCCPNYRVWNNTGARCDFRVAGTCRRVNNNGEITTTALRLISGGTIYRYSTQNGTCGGAVQATLNFDQAVSADADHDCMVNFTGTDT